MKVNRYKKRLILGGLLLALTGISTAQGMACTIFTVSSGDTVLFGNNEDHWGNNHIQFVPSSNEGFGYMVVGYYTEIPQGVRLQPEGGMNNQGLAVDANSIPSRPLNPHPERPPAPIPIHWFITILRGCATVPDAIALFQNYDFGLSSMSWQLHIADAHGDAVVISPGSDGELAFTRKGEDNGYLVSTNVNRAQPEYECKRYEIAETMLENIDHDTELTVEYARSILESVHFEGGWDSTLYSTIYDLRECIIYLYYFHQYEEVIVLNLDEELAKGYYWVPIKELFSQKVVEAADQEFQHYRIVFWGILASILAVVAGLAFFASKNIRNTWKISKLTSKRKMLHVGVLISGMIGGLISILITGLVIAILLSGNYLQYGIRPFAPIFPLLGTVSMYTILVGTYNYLLQRNRSKTLPSKDPTRLQIGGKI